MSSSRYFLAKSMNPFIGRFGLSGLLSFSFFLAGDDGGDIFDDVIADETAISRGTGRARGERGSSGNVLEF